MGAVVTVRQARRGILLVEADADSAAPLAECLWDAGYAVAVAPSLAAGLAALDGRCFALVLTDALDARSADTERWAAIARLLRRPAISGGAAGGGRGPDRGGPGPPGGDLSPPSGDHREGVL